MIARALLLAGLVALPGLARTARKTSSRASNQASLNTKGLGRACRKNTDCKSRAQRCLKESDANGKALEQGFCVLPCLSIEAGTTKVVPGHPVDPNQIDLKKKPPPRCPPHFLCRGADAGSPIDMCVKE